MEAAPRLPMIQINLIVCTEPTSFTSALKQYIQAFYNEDPESYSNEIHHLEGLRAAAIRPTIDVSGCEILRKYYCQLHFLKSRFPMEEGQPAAVLFSWKDNHTSTQCTVADIRFELMCIMYNIGALHSQLGAADVRTTPEGMKMACTHFQCAAWAFQTVKETYGHMVAYIASLVVINFFQQVCLAQAQECILEKSMLDNRKATSIAKVAVQVYDYYRTSLTILQSNHDDANMQELLGSKTYKDWIKYLSFKVAYHRCISLLFQGQQAEEQQKMGERVAFYQAACEHLEEARKMAQHFKNRPEIMDALGFTSDVVEGKRKAAKNENEFIYHEEVPAKDVLQEVKGASLVKGIAFSVNDPEVSGPDIFARLVPMAAHEASSLYSEKKAQLIRQLGELVESKDQALAEFMSSMQLEFLNKVHTSTGIPQEIVDRAAAMNARPGATQDLIDAMGKLSNIFHEVESMLNEIDEFLKEEEKSEKEYQTLMGKRPPSIIATDLAREAAKYREAHSKANDSNQTLHRAMTAHVANLKILSQPLRQLQQQLPNVDIKNSSIDQSALVELESLVSKVEEMRSQRAMLWAEYREALHNDDITSVLVTKLPNQSLEQIFQQELEKHQQLADLIKQNATAQENIKKALVEAYANSLNTRRFVQDVIQKRQSTINSLVASYEAYDDLLAKANKGIEFYTKLETNVTKLLQRIKGACKVQQEEREQMLSKNETPKTDYVPPSVPASTTPKLKDYLEARKKNPVNNYGESKVPQYPPVNYSDPQAWPPGVRPAPLGSEVNDILPPPNSQEVYNYPTNVQYYNQPTPGGYPYPSEVYTAQNPSFNPTDTRTQNPSYIPTDTRTQNPNYNTTDVRTQNLPATDVRTQKSPYSTDTSGTYGTTDNTNVDHDLASRMSNLLNSSKAPQSNTPYNVQPQYSYSSYTPQNYAATYSYSTQPNNNVTPSQSQSYDYDPNKAYTSTTNSYQPISSHIPSYLPTSDPTSTYTQYHDTTNYSNNPANVGNYQNPGTISASTANTGPFQNSSNNPVSTLPAISAGTNPYQTNQSYQYPSNAYNQYPNTYYPAGYAPDYANQTVPASSDYASLNYHSNQYASSVQPDITHISNSTYSSPTVGTASFNTPRSDYMATGTPDSTQPEFTYNQNYQQYPYAAQSVDQNQTPGSYMSNQGYYYQTPGYNNQPGYEPNTSTDNSQNQQYIQQVQPQQPVQQVQPQQPIQPAGGPKKESNIDLLSGLDFTISQAPLVPQQNTVTPTSTQPETPKQTSSNTEVTAKPSGTLLEKTPSTEKPKTPQIKILPSKPLNNGDVKNLFKQELEKFEKYVDVLPNKTLSGPTNLDLKWKEIQDMQDADGQKKIISVARCYPMKNRYPDILPYDACRVELTESKDDYINASYVKGISPYAPLFIVTQAPLPSTISDFWTMIREQQVELIFCLLNDSEIGNDIYWPKEKGVNLTVSNMVISLQSVIAKTNWTERLISVTIPERRESWVVMHLQFTSWPGSLFPTSPDPFMDYVKEVINLHQQQRSITHPIVVHCSSGIGRAGLVPLLTAAVLDVTNNSTSIPDLAQLAMKLSNCQKNILRDREHLKFAYEAFLSYMRQAVIQDKLKSKLKDVVVNTNPETQQPSEVKEVNTDPLSTLDPFWASKK